MKPSFFVYVVHDSQDVFEFLQTLNNAGARFVSMGTYEHCDGFIITYEHHTEITE